MSHYWRNLIGSIGIVVMTPFAYAAIETDDIALQDIQVADIEPEDAEWKGKLKFGGSLNTGNSDNRNFAGGAVLNYLKGRWDWLGEVDGEFTRAQGETTAENITGRLESRYQIHDKYYLFAKADATRDKFAAYDVLAVESVGIGRVLWDTDDSRLLFELGPGATQRRISGVGTYEYEAILNLDTRYRQKINDTTDFFQGVSVDIDRLNTHIEAFSVINTNFTKHLALEFSFRLFHDTRIPPGSSNTKKTDTVTRVAIVYEF